MDILRKSAMTTIGRQRYVTNTVVNIAKAVLGVISIRSYFACGIIRFGYDE